MHSQDNKYLVSLGGLSILEKIKQSGQIMKHRAKREILEFRLQRVEIENLISLGYKGYYIISKQEYSDFKKIIENKFNIVEYQDTGKYKRYLIKKSITEEV